MATWTFPIRGQFSESLEWLTDVIRCRSKEYRQAKRKSPRQELTYNHVLTPSQFGEAKTMAQDLGAESLLVPLWSWYTRPGDLASGATTIPKDTADSQLLYPVGSSVLIWESHEKCETCEVLLNSTNPAYPYITLTSGLSQAYTNPVLVPLRTGQFAQEFEATRSSTQSVSCSSRFRIVTGDDHYSDYTTFGGLYSSASYGFRPLMTDRPLSGGGIREQFERRFDELDSAIGDVYRYPTLSRPEQGGQVAWYAQTRAGVRALTYWLHSRKGKWKSFWVPSWSSDLTIANEIASSDTTIQVNDIGLRTYATFPINIMVLTKAGVFICKNVTSAAAGTSGREVLTLSSQFGANLYTWDIDLCCFLTLCRLDSDRVEINRNAGGLMSVSVPIVEVPV